jgi:hypothetical protein
MKADEEYPSYLPVFRIHDILVWIRIRGSMPLTNGLMDLDPDSDPDPDPSIFIIDLQDANKKRIKKKSFSAWYLLFEGTGTYTSFFKDKKSKRSHKVTKTEEIKGFSYYFCLMIEGSRSIPLTNGSGYGSMRPKNMWIQWIRIRNTATCCVPVSDIFPPGQKSALWDSNPSLALDWAFMT